MSEQELIELLADMEHASWAHWMKYLFSQCEQGNFGQMVIPAKCVARWSRQADTPYADLSEKEKESDRDEVARIIPIIREYSASNLHSKDEWKESISQFIQQKLSNEKPT